MNDIALFHSHTARAPHKRGTRGIAAQTTRSLFVSVGAVTYPLESLEHASVAYRATIEKLNLGGSQTPQCTIIARDGAIVGHVSYNGRVWFGHPTEWQPNDKPLFDPMTRKD